MPLGLRVLGCPSGAAALLCGPRGAFVGIIVGLAATAEGLLAADAADAISGLRDWLVERGARISDAVDVVHSESRGAELIAGRAIAAGEEILFVPVSATISSGRAALESTLAHDVSALWEGDGPGVRRPLSIRSGDKYWFERLEEMRSIGVQGQLALAALVVDERRRGTASAFAPWLAVVPTDYPFAPSLWTAEQLRCLAGTGEHDILVEKQKRWLEEYQALLRFVPGFRDISFLEFARGRVSVESRTHGLILGDTPHEVTSFVPFADLMNHNSTFTVLWKSDRTPQRPGFHAVATTDLPAGSALSCSYGRKELGEFVRTYGFADEGAPREVQLQLELDRADDYRPVRQSLLLELGAYRTFSVRSIPPVMPSQVFALLLLFLRAATATPDDLELAAQQGSFPVGAVDPDCRLRSFDLLARAAAASFQSELASGAAVDATTAYGRLCGSFRTLRSEVLAGVASFARHPEHSAEPERGVAGEVARSLRELLAAHDAAALPAGHVDTRLNEL